MKKIILLIGLLCLSVLDVRAADSNSVAVDRSVTFDPDQFIHEGGWNRWTIWQGPSEGKGRVGPLDQDDRSVGLTQIDLTKVRFRTFLKPGERSITGEEQVRRLKAGGEVRLDAQVLQALLKYSSLIPERWKKKTGDSPTYIFFDGTVLSDFNGHRYSLYLCFIADRWQWRSLWLGTERYANYPSAVLVP